MKRILTALVLIPLVLLVVFRAPDWLLFALLGAVAVLALSEYLQMVASYAVAHFRLTTVLLTAAYFALIVTTLFMRSTNSVEILLLTTAVLFLIGPSIYLAVGMRESELRSVLPGAAMSFFGIPYIAGALACLGVLRSTAGGWFFVLFTFFAVWAGDTAAMYVGKAIGRIKFSPRISPNKTWEGAIASVAGAVVVAGLFAHYAPQVESWLAHLNLLPEPGVFGPPMAAAPFRLAATLAIIINIAAQMGDLFESLIKRGAGVKDSGTLLPGHGGVLDRIDALLFAAPVALLLFTLFGNGFLAFR